jgi:hypothetical protein
LFFFLLWQTGPIADPTAAVLFYACKISKTYFSPSLESGGREEGARKEREKGGETIPQGVVGKEHENELLPSLACSSLFFSPGKNIDIVPRAPASRIWVEH